ncbi:MBL fold metallo-hydrolase [Methanoregula sp.]|uniref:MBL fold metallo-hydrolase n=1 Tax=Methanoregula sp. TaxID=2052170 RepID=UPI002C7500C6|nr:MBL fold metallo-hydrolase [Methanoregula sp.]HVP96105.1 MBL fold metallo-hydrolase [Methanoregula sp.]
MTAGSGSPVIPIPLGHVNAFLIRGTRPVVVDTGFPGSAPKILSVLQKEGYRPWDLGLIIITHAHLDHTGSAAALAGATGAPVLVHTAEADYLAAGTSAPVVPASLTGRFLRLMIGKHAPAPDLGVQAVIRINAPYRIDAFGINGAILPTPGHTKGSLSVSLATGEVIAGDLVTGLFPPLRARLPIFAEDAAEVKASIRVLLATAPATIYAGHGGPFPGSDVEALLQ